MTEFFVGLLGVGAGFAAVFTAELWKQVLDFRVSSRIVKYEIDMNESRLKAKLGNFHADLDTDISEDAWLAARTNLAFLLPLEEWRVIARLYAGLHMLGLDLRNVTPDNEEGVKSSIEGVIQSMELPTEILRRMENRRRPALLLDALLGKTTSPALLPGGE